MEARLILAIGLIQQGNELVLGCLLLITALHFVMSCDVAPIYTVRITSIHNVYIPSCKDHLKTIM